MSSLVADNTATVAESVGCTEVERRTFGADLRIQDNSQAILDCLREVPLESLMDTSVAIARQLRPPFGELAFYPSYDGDYISDRPSVLLRKGAFVKVMLTSFFSPSIT